MAWPLAWLLGCAGNPTMQPDDEGGTSGADDSTSTSSATLPEPTTSSTTHLEPADDTTAGPSTTGSVFVPPHDLGEGGQCSPFAQDCPAGNKCVYWANDGGSAWNDTRCVPVAEDPAGVGEPCTVEGSPFTGLDDCEHGAMCWNVDPTTGEGTCWTMCQGSYDDPWCADPSEYCSIPGGDPLLLCHPVCDPLVQDCDDGWACIAIQNAWECAPDGSGEMGGHGDPCEAIDACDPGLVCVGAQAVPPGLPCEGSAGCCTEICDSSDPLGDAQCTGAAEGQICQPWHDEGALPLFDDVGVCALP